MKKIIVSIIIVWSSIVAQGQIENHLFSEVDESIKSSLDLEFIGAYSLLNLNETNYNNILDTRPERLEVTLDYDGRPLKMELKEVELYKKDFHVRTATGESYLWSEMSRSVFYQGHFPDYPGSHFALSVLNNEVIGIGSIPGIGDLNLGKLETSELYVFYSEKAIDGQNSFSCETRGEFVQPEGFDPSERTLVEDCVGIYFEVDNDIFVNKGGLTGATDYMNALFNEIQLLYEIDGMTIYISDMKVWNVVSPYDGIVGTSPVLGLFGTTTTVWDGDLGHLVNFTMSGGLAWLNGFCSGDQALRKAVSGISPSFAGIPVYSWSVEVVSHEMGHNMGSPHTHACVWNGDMTAIDGCGPAAGFDEGCDAEIPADGGTVMSYCHLESVGIDLGFGFGDQPGELMRENILASACLTSCDLQVMDVHVNSATISVTCENGPIVRQLSITNNGNENMYSCTVNVYLEGAITETFDWSGFILEGGTGTITLPTVFLPLGTYSMLIEIILPDGYDDEDPSDNTYTYNFDVTEYPNADFTPDPDELISLNAETTMINNTTGAVSYWWNMGDGTNGITESNPEHTFPFEKGGDYRVMLLATSAFGCVDTTYAPVHVEGINIYYIPNSFTPDGNLFNDVFTPIFSANLDIYDYHFTIFNKWGEIVFESYNVAWGWDGSYGDKKNATEGVYIWELEFGDLTSDEKHTETGHVYLLR